MVQKRVIGKGKKSAWNKVSITLGIIVVLLLVWAVVHYYWQPAKPVIEQQVSITSENGKVNVEIKGFAFNPSEITIKAGESIVWINQDGVSHSVRGDSGNEINSPSLSKGESYEHQFNEAGTYDYHCEPHKYMKGKVIVE